jgi:hypothetical protein
VKGEEKERCHSFVLSWTSHTNEIKYLHTYTYIPLMLYPLRGSRGISDIQIFSDINGLMMMIVSSLHPCEAGVGCFS